MPASGAMPASGQGRLNDAVTVLTPVGGRCRSVTSPAEGTRVPRRVPTLVGVLNNGPGRSGVRGGCLRLGCRAMRAGGTGPDATSAWRRTGRSCSPFATSRPGLIRELLLSARALLAANLDVILGKGPQRRPGLTPDGHLTDFLRHASPDTAQPGILSGLGDPHRGELGWREESSRR
jgi:hypothetical protein